MQPMQGRHLANGAYQLLDSIRVSEVAQQLDDGSHNVPILVAEQGGQGGDGAQLDQLRVEVRGGRDCLQLPDLLIQVHLALQELLWVVPELHASLHVLFMLQNQQTLFD